VGAICTLLDIAVLFVLTDFAGVNYLVSSVISFILGATLNYGLCILWIFDISRISNRLHEFGYYLLITLAVLAVNTMLMWVLTSLLGFYFVTSKLVAVIVTYVLNFSLRKALLHTVWTR